MVPCLDWPALFGWQLSLVEKGIKLANMIGPIGGCKDEPTWSDRTVELSQSPLRTRDVIEHVVGQHRIEPVPRKRKRLDGGLDAIEVEFRSCESVPS